MTAPEVKVVPVISDEDGSIILYDIFIDNKWVGSRRTIPQCEEQVRNATRNQKNT